MCSRNLPQLNEFSWDVKIQFLHACLLSSLLSNSSSAGAAVAEQDQAFRVLQQHRETACLPIGWATSQRTISMMQLTTGASAHSCNSLCKQAHGWGPT